MFETERLVKVAKRENNLKRSYLYVNPLQGKHIPINPGKTKQMCKALADEVSIRHANEKLFIIGFAETATAIASYVASFLKSAVYFENTTREKEMEGDKYFYFTESHSHATEQKLNAKWFDDCFFMIDRIVFVEDEVTTGNTICKLIEEIKVKFLGRKINFSIASVLNSMSEERIKELESDNIACIYLKKIPFEYGIDSIGKYKEKDVCMYDYTEDTYSNLVKINQVVERMNPRSICKVDEYIMRTTHFCGYIYKNEFRNRKYDQVLVVGTEEFMYPAIELAGYLQEKKVCGEVKSQSTTRSPIMAFNNDEYPLHNRYKLRSLYDDERATYLYNLKKYDKVVIVTDSKLISHRGIESLIVALEIVGNSDISVYQWIV